MAESFKDRHFYSILNEAVPELSQTKPMDSIHSREVPSLQCAIIISEDLPKYLIKISIHISFVINWYDSGTWRFRDVMDLAGSDQMKEINQIQRKIQFDEPANIQFTSVH